MISFLGDDTTPNGISSLPPLNYKLDQVMFDFARMILQPGLIKVFVILCHPVRFG